MCIGISLTPSIIHTLWIPYEAWTLGDTHAQCTDTQQPTYYCAQKPQQRIQNSTFFCKQSPSWNKSLISNLILFVQLKKKQDKAKLNTSIISKADLDTHKPI